MSAVERAVSSTVLSSVRSITFLTRDPDNNSAPTFEARNNLESSPENANTLPTFESRDNLEYTK